MSNKFRLPAILSYITIFAWPVALLMHIFFRKTATNVFHLRQSCGLHVLWALLFLFQFGFTFVPFLGKYVNILISLLFIILLVLWLVGLIRAIGGSTVPIPFVGQFFQKKLIFII